MSERYGKCPCCGSNVPVYAGDEGTSGYKPVDVEVLHQNAKKLKAVLDAAKEYSASHTGARISFGENDNKAAKAYIKANRALLKAIKKAENP